jgi:hypothetical protein
MSDQATNTAFNNKNRKPGNPTGERFLFVFTPDEPALQGPCGCSLKTGSQLIAIFFIICIIPAFMKSFYTNDLISVLFYLSASVLYLIAGICILYSSITYSYVYAHTASLIYSFCFVVNFIDYAVVLIMVFMGKYQVMTNLDNLTLVLYLASVITVILLIHAYLLWIIYSYMVHLKQGRISLVRGNVYKSYDEFDREIINPERI